MKKPLPVVLTIGIAVGFALTAVVFGVGATHVVCGEGPMVGWSGPLASPDDIGLAPPGGFVNSSFTETTVYNATDSSGESGYNSIPQNSTKSDFEVVNWTLHSQSSTVVPGWGSRATCTGDQLFPGNNGYAPVSGCAGCPVVPPAPAGVGQRLVVPQQFFYGNLSSVIINATYGPTPIASISWSENQSGTAWSNPAELSGLNVTIAPFYEHGQLYGLGITIRQTSIGFGVPIHLLSGGYETMPASFPQDFPWGPPGSTTMSIVNTYVLPAATGQGTWAVYLPGDDGTYSPGGLLFEQTATT